MRIKNLTFNMIPNSLRHPTESGEYFVVTVYGDYFHDKYTLGYVTTLRYSKKYDAWNATDDKDPHAQIDHHRILAWTPFKHIADSLQPMVNEYSIEILETKLAKAQAKLAEIVEEETHEQ